MTLQLAAFAALIVPLCAWLLWRRSLATVYHGDAFVSDKFRGAGTSGQWAVVLDVFNYGQHIVYVDKSHADRLDRLSPATVTLHKRAFSKTFVDAFSLKGEAPRSTGDSFSGFYLAGYYLILGLGVAVASIHMTGGMSRLCLSIMAINLAAAGFVFNLFHRSQQDAAKTGDAKFLTMRLGTGRGSLYAMAFFTLVATIACYWSFTFLILFPGLHMVFAFGGVMGTLLRQAFRLA